MLPNLIIIGAQKCGTSALHHYLGLHPDIFMSEEKELNFFIQDMNWGKGRAWYESMFTDAAKVRGESSPNYTFYPSISRVPEMMHSLIPEAKLIYVVRDPIERIISHYMHNCRRGYETRSLSKALRGSAGVPMEDTRFVHGSKYYMQLQQYLAYFPASNILIVSQDDLLKHRGDTLRDVFRFLDVDETFQSEKFLELVHTSSDRRVQNRMGLALARTPVRGLIRRLPRLVRRPAEWVLSRIVTSKARKPMLDERLRQELIMILEDDIAQFRKYAARPFADWSV